MKKLKITFISFSLLAATISFCANNNSSKYPPEVEKVLVKAGTNRIELERFLNYCRQTNDSLKWKAGCFLVANMDAHYSENYKWITQENQPYQFDELGYPNFDQAQAARDKLILEKKMKAEYFKTEDVETVTADFLANHLRHSFEKWKQHWAKHLTFDQFCETLLPYRSVNEKLEDWQPLFEKEFGFMSEFKDQELLKATERINKYIFNYFVSSFNFENRVEPISFLSPKQLLFRKQGPCQDNVNYISLAMKSQGLPCYVDFVPYHATSTGRHYWNTTITGEGDIFPFETDNAGFHKYKIKREPGKVFRICYAKQPNNLTDSYPDEPIPNNHLRFKNIKDVTADYWKVTNVFWAKPVDLKPKVVFISVFNGLNWRCTDWCKTNANVLQFRNMSTGVVYLPVQFNGQRNIAIGYPQTIDSTGLKILLKPDLKNTMKIIMREQENYLIYRPGKRYTLFYWDNRWVKVEEKIANETLEIEFDNVPVNALYLMLPEYTKGKERPFTINSSGMRVWW